jgi:predicted nucleic acid-binding Zn ribbon protein
MKVFRCPSCHEFIAADATKCRFCSAPVDAETAKSAAAAQEKENKLYRRKHYARHIFIGVGVFALGLVITVALYRAGVYSAWGRYVSSPGGGYFSPKGGFLDLITFGLMLSGGGEFIYGLAGWWGELE